MTNTEALRALAAKWRADAGGISDDQSLAREWCAEELEALIANLPAEAGSAAPINPPETFSKFTDAGAERFDRYQTAVSERDELRTERLDWMIRNCAVVETDGSGNWRVRFDWMPEGDNFGPYADSPLAAIDAAMREDSKP